VNDKIFTATVEKIVSKIIGKENIINISKPTMAGEDMSYFLKAVPGTYFFLGGLKAHQHHNPRFDIDENSLKTAANVLINVVHQWTDDI
jgi:amidohydrolase